MIDILGQSLRSRRRVSFLFTFLDYFEPKQMASRGKKLCEIHKWVKAGAHILGKACKTMQMSR